MAKKRGRRGKKKSSSSKKPKSQEEQLFKCYVCQESKPMLFWFYLPRGLECHTCYTKIFERRRQKEKWMAIKAGWFTGYDCPGWQDQHLEFRQTTPVREDLVGTYDMVYYAQADYNRDFHRKMSGTMELKWVGDDRVLEGNVDPENRHVVLPHYDFHFKVIEKEELPSFGNTMQLGSRDGYLGYKVPSDCEAAPEDRFGTLRIVASRHAVGWLADNDPFKGSGFADDLSDSIRYDSIEEADALLREYNETRSFKWISNHTVLSEEVASIVSAFARSKPPPVFFFEEGGLWLQTVWEESFTAPCESVMVFRRRVEM